MARQIKLLKQLFKTNDHSSCRIHSDSDNLMPMVCQITAACFEDDCADELTNDPVMTAILDKDTLASQPTLSRFWNRMDEDTLSQLDMLQSKMREIVYSIKHPEHMLFDLDSTLLNTYGNQEGEGFNFHYQAHGYHPMLCYDGLTGDLLKAELRDGTKYCSNGADQFMITPISILARSNTLILRTLSIRRNHPQHWSQTPVLRRSFSFLSGYAPRMHAVGRPVLSRSFQEKVILPAPGLPMTKILCG